MYAYVYTPLRPYITMILTLYKIGCIISAAFQFFFMALAVDVIDRPGLSNEICRQLQLKKTKVMLLYYLFI